MLSRLTPRGRVAQQQSSIFVAPSLRTTSVRHGSGAALFSRIKSVRNIEKITKAMKLVATARLRRSQQRMEIARRFAAPLVTAWPDPENIPKTPYGDYMMVGLSSDRGLCGGANAVISRGIRDRLRASIARGDKKPNVVMFGDKGKAGVEMVAKGHLSLAITDAGKLAPLSFDQVCELVDIVTKTKFDVMEVVSNKYKNMISYETLSTFFYPLSVAYEPKLFAHLELEGDLEIFQNFYDWRMSCMFWMLFRDLETVELSARMNAMTNSNKNAGEMAATLWQKYNRMRQDKVTTELIEIISGAVAAAPKKA